jgi:hypothetical protein
LDEGCELADAAALLSEDFLGVGCADDDVGDGWGDADLDARVSLLSELTLEELVQLCVENTVCNKLPPLGAVEDILLAICIPYIHSQSFSSSSLCVFRSHAGVTGRAYIAAPGTPEAMFSVYEDGIEPVDEVQNYLSSMVVGW